MKLYLATARLDDIRWATDAGLADGVFTTPGLLAEAGAVADGRELLAEVCRATGLSVLASVGTVRSTDVYREGRELAKLSDQIEVAIPFVEDSIAAMGRLRTDGVRVIATLVYGPAQAILAAKAGAYGVSVAVDQLDLNGQDGAEAVRDIVAVLRDGGGGVECDTIASLPQNPAQFARCARAGAEAIVVTPDVLRSLLTHPLTDRGLDQWLRDIATQHRPRVTA
jgi:transaldolase